MNILSTGVFSMRIFRPLIGLFCLYTVLVTSVGAKVMPVEFDAGRNRLIAYMLSHQLPAQHFGHKALDDELSRAAFDLYMRQLDPRKRFLFTSDVRRLEAFADHIDDELSRGRIVLPDAGMQILNERVREVQSMVDEILDAGFDPGRKEYVESDPKKLQYPADRAARRERWRKSLKLDVLETYLSAVEDENKKREKENKPLLPEDPAHIDKKLWDKAVAKVRKRTHNYLHRLLQVTRQEHYNRYFDAVARAFDPHTNYMAPTSKEDFDIHMSGSLEGIGALLREDDGHIKVVRIIPGSAAERQGQLHAEDTILAVSEKDGDPVDISDMRIREAVSYIRGPKGTEVRLTIQRPDGTRMVIPIVRDVVRIEETYVKSAILKDKDGQKIGYIRIPSFYRDFSGGRKGEKPRNVTDDTRAELYRLKKEDIKGLILDLRNNGGGSLSDAVDVSGLFLPGGPVVQVKNSQGMIRVLEDEDSTVSYDGPMIVLVNQFSASASEILAAALQDYGRALIVGGAHTHGKGTVQALVDMNRNLPLLHLKKYDDLGALKVTIQKFYRVNGGSTQYRGVVPDVVLPSMLDYLKTGEKYMDYSLPWDQVEDVGRQEWDGARFHVRQAEERSREYVSRSKKFQKIKEESLKAEERSKQTRVADYLSGLIKERKELEVARKEAREAGLMSESVDPDEKDSGEKKSLDEQLADDPYVQLALFLMSDDSLITGRFGQRK
jgi:carboxyl-terminal processing protease